MGETNDATTRAAGLKLRTLALCFLRMTRARKDYARPRLAPLPPGLRGGYHPALTERERGLLERLRVELQHAPRGSVDLADKYRVHFPSLVAMCRAVDADDITFYVLRESDGKRVAVRVWCYADTPPDPSWSEHWKDRYLARRASLVPFTGCAMRVAL